MPSLNPKRTREIKTERRKILFERLGNKCAKCGGTDRLEFDHIDPKSKSFCIGVRLDYSLKKLKLEADKCQLLCKPCHIIKTKIDNGYQPVSKHGTASMYNNQLCRCDRCKKAWTTYKVPKTKAYRARKRREYAILQTTG